MFSTTSLAETRGFGVILKLWRLQARSGGQEKGFPARQCCCALSGAGRASWTCSRSLEQLHKGGDQFKSTNELRELSPPDCCTMKPKSLCICSKPWLSTLPKPWAGPGCEIPENQSPALSLDPFPREGALFRWCRNFLHLPDASSWDPCESVAQPREPGSPSCVLQEPGSLQGVSQSLCFPLGLGKAPPSTAPRWDTGVAVWGAPRAPQLFLELAGLGGCKEATLKCSMEKQQSGEGWPGFGYHGMSQRSGGLASSWSRCHHPHCSRAVTWMSLEKTLLLRKTAHLFFSGWE